MASPDAERPRRRVRTSEMCPKMTASRPPRPMISAQTRLAMAKPSVPDDGGYGG